MRPAHLRVTGPEASGGPHPEYTEQLSADRLPAADQAGLHLKHPFHNGATGGTPHGAIRRVSDAAIPDQRNSNCWLYKENQSVSNGSLGIMTITDGVNHAATGRVGIRV
jgi:hypothetical protein